MPRLPIVSGAKAVKAFRRLGFEQVRQRGSHVIMKRVTEKGAVGCAVPLHHELAPGTLRGILRRANVSVEEFVRHL